MSIEQQEISALKAQVNSLREALVLSFNGAWDDDHAIDLDAQVRLAISSTPEQCLSSVKADAVEEFFKYMIGEGMVSDNGVDAFIDDFLNDGLLTPLKNHFVDKLRNK